MDLTTEKQETDARPKAGEDGAECRKSSFCLFLSFQVEQQLILEGGCCQIHLKPVQTDTEAFSKHFTWK